MQFLSIFVVFPLILSCFLAIDVQLDPEWKLWKETHKKEYSSVQEHLRRQIWEENLKKVRSHNDQADRGLHTYRLGMNEYADMTLAELVKPTRRESGIANDRRWTWNFTGNGLPAFVDWRDRDVVTGVRDEGQCASDWAMSAIGALEGQTAIHKSNLIYLSAQNLIDCSQGQGNRGCQSGTVNAAFEYVKVNGGIDTETSYPYEGQDLPCRFRKEDTGAQNTGYVNLKSADENVLQNALARIGPISVAIDGNHSSFHLYQSGIYDQPSCSQTDLNRALLVVGYGTDASHDYWLVKNSWGFTWGMEGYIRMSRNKNNQCGIATDATFPTV